jgi:hypothetical protein
MNGFIIVSKHESHKKWKAFVTQSYLLYDDVNVVKKMVTGLNKRATEEGSGFRYAYAPITLGNVVVVE